MCLWGSRWWLITFRAQSSPKPHGGLNRHFKPKMRIIQIAIFSDLCIRLTWNLTGSCGQQQTSWVITVWTVVQAVLTATFNSYGDRQISTPYKINTPEPIDKKSAQLITSARGLCIPNLIQIHPLGASGQMGEIIKIFFIYTFFFLRHAHRSDPWMDFYTR